MCCSLENTLNDNYCPAWKILMYHDQQLDVTLIPSLTMHSECVSFERKCKNSS